MKYPVFWAPIISIILTQGFKSVVNSITGKRLSWESLFVTGGMPSSHSATVASLTTAVFFVEGLSPLFFVCLFFSLIVIRDAVGVRQSVGEQAKALNQLLKIKVKEIYGHTGTQVFVGLCVGVVVGIGVYYV